MISTPTSTLWWPTGCFSASRRRPRLPHQPPACHTFHPLPDTPLKPLEELFRAKVINLLVEQKLLPAERIQVLYSWKHSGFNVHAGERVPPEAKADLEDLAQYILRNPFSVEEMTLEWPADMVIYRSRLNAKINRNFEVFTATDFLAAITQHIPDPASRWSATTAGTATRCAASATGACRQS